MYVHVQMLRIAAVRTVSRDLGLCYNIKQYMVGHEAIIWCVCGTVVSYVTFVVMHRCAPIGPIAC